MIQQLTITMSTHQPREVNNGDPDSNFQPQQDAPIKPSPEDNIDRDLTRTRSNDSSAIVINNDNSERKETKIINNTLQKDQARQTVTMRELLKELECGYTNANSPSSATPPRRFVMVRF